jgi:hypothetical protein
MSKTLRLLLLISGIACCGCVPVSVYQSPISNFQTAVLTANDSIRPYLLGINNLIAEGNLYDKVGMGANWGTEDLHAGIPPQDIQVRLQALSTIASYANALATVANAKDVDQLQQAAQTFGSDVKGLQSTVQQLAAKGKPSVDLSGPVSALVTLFGTLAIEHKQKAAIEAAILNGDQPVSQLIDLLKTDLRSVTVVDDTSYAAIQRGMVKLYNDARAKTDPKGLISLIDDFVQQNNRIQTLRALQVDSLLSDMEGAHAALVAYAKSGKGPKDLSDLAGRIDVFTVHVKLFRDAIASVQSAVKPSN